MIAQLLLPITFRQSDLEQVSKYSSGLSGDEIRLACKEIKMNQIRQTIANSKTNNKKVITSVVDAINVFKNMKPTTLSIIHKYHEWSNDYEN